MVIINDGDIPYKFLNDKRPTNSAYFSSLKRSSTLENAMVGIVKQFYLTSILHVAGEQRNAEAWSSYWNKIPSDVINNSNLNYVIYASTTDQSGDELYKLDASLSVLQTAGYWKTNANGISLDVSPSHLYLAEKKFGYLMQYSKDLDEKRKIDTSGEKNSITYGPDNFIYYSVNSSPGSVVKADPISLNNVKVNTDVWFEPATIESSGDNFQYIENVGAYGNDDWDTDGDGTTDGGNAYTVASQGAWAIPCPTITNLLSDLPHNISYFGNPDFVDGTVNGKSLRIDFTMHVRDTDTYEISLHSNDKGKFEFLDGTTFDSLNASTGNGGAGSSFIEFKQNFYNTTTADYATVSLSEGTYSVSMKHKESGSGLNYLLAIRKQGESTWRNIPVFRGPFGFLNYDPVGNLYVQNDYGIFKWDAINMICKEAQPLSDRAKDVQVAGDILLGGDYLYVPAMYNWSAERSQGKEMLKLNKNDLSIVAYANTNFAQDLGNARSHTMHSTPENTFILNGGGSLRRYDYDMNQLSGSSLPNNGQYGKITVLPDGHIIANGGSVLVKFNPDFSNAKDGNGNDIKYDLNAPCSGLVYDIE